jgi:hypothetical protein
MKWHSWTLDSEFINFCSSSFCFCRGESSLFTVLRVLICSWVRQLPPINTHTTVNKKCTHQPQQRQGHKKKPHLQHYSWKSGPHTWFAPRNQEQKIIIYLPYFSAYKTHFFHLKICLKNGVCPIRQCVLYAKKYGEFWSVKVYSILLRSLVRSCKPSGMHVQHMLTCWWCQFEFF